MTRYLLLLTTALLASCAVSPTPNYDKRFGDALRQGRQAQTLNTQPSTNPITGMDGKSAKEAVERYVNTSKSPPPPVNVINIGGTGR